MSLKQPNWTRILTILLVILASLALLYIGASILFRFTQALLLFVLGAILAYILSPLVGRLTVAFRVRWIAVAASYFLVAAALFGLAVSLFTPFVDQSKSLVDNLHNPSYSSTSGLRRVVNESQRLRDTIRAQRAELAIGATLSRRQARDTIASISGLIRDLQALPRGTVHAVQTTPTGSKSSRSATPLPQTTVPASYVSTALADAQTLLQQYSAAALGSAALGPPRWARTESDASTVATDAAALYHTVSTTPILLLRAQTWLDGHGIHFDLHHAFGQAAGQISNQSTLILDNAITVLSETATVLLDITLILIISFYLVSDGPRLVRASIGMVPPAHRNQARFFVTKLDEVLGGYIRGQIFLALLAGVLGGGGAAVLGVPYPLLIGVATALLQLVPVIGPMVGAIPAVLISLFFQPILTTVILFAWFMLFQQVVTNVVGPKLMGIAVGIHPLEALLAVLIGYPLGGLLGAFLAVPIMGILHVLVREAYAYFVLGRALPSRPESPEEPRTPTPLPPGNRDRAV